MEITEVRIKLMDDPQERLQAFCSVTFDHSFVIRDLKIIEGAKGSFVAMPSRKLTDRCPQCHMKNHLRATFCNQCGVRLQEDRATKDGDGRAKLYADIAHPINSRCRELIQNCVLQSFREEQVKAQQPGYICTYDDYGEDNFATLVDMEPLTTECTLPECSLPAACIGQSDSSHRIESAGAMVNPPHHHVRTTRDSEIAGVREGEFGAGIM